MSEFDWTLLVVIFLLIGCNPKTKNNDKLIPRLLAKENGHKLAIKEIRKGERMFGKTGKNNDPWRLTLYDSVCVKKDELTDMFMRSDSETPGKVTKEDFLDILRNARIAMPEDDLMKLVLDVYVVENLITYKDFILGKKYINKQYLISSFGPKKKRKKKVCKLFCKFSKTWVIIFLSKG